MRVVGGNMCLISEITVMGSVVVIPTDGINGSLSWWDQSSCWISRGRCLTASARPLPHWYTAMGFLSPFPADGIAIPPPRWDLSSHLINEGHCLVVSIGPLPHWIAAMGFPSHSLQVGSLSHHHDETDCPTQSTRATAPKHQQGLCPTGIWWIRCHTISRSADLLSTIGAALPL